MSSESSTSLKCTNDIPSMHRPHLSDIQIIRERERAVLSQAIPAVQYLGMRPQENGGILGRKHGLRGAVVLAMLSKNWDFHLGSKEEDIAGAVGRGLRKNRRNLSFLLLFIVTVA
ncbi:hypothetical protein SIIN_5398_T [Serendipita indica DSM 11827]|nr:hypothetical protein SIIN_5398_T [Serendipita indica DSM 11827]